MTLMMIACPMKFADSNAACAVRTETVVRMAAHIAEFHLETQNAMKLAREAADRGRVEVVEAPVLSSPAAKTFASQTIKLEVPMSTNRKAADPAACQICARLTKSRGAPSLCKRHGGPGHSTSYRGQGPKRDQIAPAEKRLATELVRKPNGRPTVASLLTETRKTITTLREQLKEQELRERILVGFEDLGIR